MTIQNKLTAYSKSHDTRFWGIEMLPEGHERLQVKLYSRFTPIIRLCALVHIFASVDCCCTSMGNCLEITVSLGLVLCLTTNV